MSARPKIPEAVTTVVVSRGSGGKVVHRPHAAGEKPACDYRKKDVDWRQVDLEAVEPFARPCRYCFGERPGESPLAKP